MSIVLKENEWAEIALEECDLSKKPFETLRRISRYYIDKGYKDKDIRILLENFVIKCNRSASIVMWSNTIERAIKTAHKFPAINIDYINIYKEEIDAIESIKGVQTKRIAFTLLCLSKYWNIITNSSSYWVNSKYSEINKIANVSASSKRQGAMYRELMQAGLIELSRIVDNTNVRVCFAKEDGDVAITIKDFRNLGNQYQMYKGKPFFSCSCCGIVVKIDNPNPYKMQKYCKDCLVKLKTKQWAEATARYIEKHK